MVFIVFVNAIAIGWLLLPKEQASGSDFTRVALTAQIHTPFPSTLWVFYSCFLNQFDNRLLIGAADDILFVVLITNCV